MALDDAAYFFLKVRDMQLINSESSKFTPPCNLSYALDYTTQFNLKLCFWLTSSFDNQFGHSFLTDQRYNIFTAFSLRHRPPSFYLFPWEEPVNRLVCKADPMIYEMNNFIQPSPTISHHWTTNFKEDDLDGCTLILRSLFSYTTIIIINLNNTYLLIKSNMLQCPR